MLSKFKKSFKSHPFLFLSKRMALHHDLCFGVLVMEVCYMILLLTPIHKLRQFLVWFGKSALFQQVLYFARISSAFIAILFVDATYRMFAVHQEDHAIGKSPGLDAIVNSKLFYAQRNFYLTGFTLLMGISILRMQTMISAMEEDLEQVTELKEEQSHTNEDYTALLQKVARYEKELSGRKDYDTLLSDYKELNTKYSKLTAGDAQIAS
eukprot:NODE_1066_length_2351_cov_0.355240.p1 type:complete len:209 gc:universal NODE_1066_length_2351_cov_0.355240:1190-564(-)